MLCQIMENMGFKLVSPESMHETPATNYFLSFPKISNSMHGKLGKIGTLTDTGRLVKRARNMVAEYNTRF